MQARLIGPDGLDTSVSAAQVGEQLERGTPFWLDIEGITDDVVELLRDGFGFHPLAVEDAEHFGQRPKVEEYDDFVYLVVFGALPSALVEVHCFYSARFLVTVHHAPCPFLGEVADRLRRRKPVMEMPLVLHRVVDRLVDSYFPVLAALDDRIDELEDEILAAPTDEQLGELFDMKRFLMAVRKVVTPQRDMFAATVGGAYDLPAMSPEAERYFRDIYDHLIRISDLVDSYRDLLSGALDAHLATVSNRLNGVMKQLTIIATIFLPLSFLTGFFGQNFGWLVNHLSGAAIFIGAGLGLEVLAVVGLLSLFHRRGWL